ncbi:LysM peptidoglycan-binding domain-containing protein [Chitinophaga japonensis]|uniref:LysM domain-containing protein n=1 Tax=Chitinophaga japonensis TaxID=104662 RepID=A0A562SL69_CHIJA|nr:LysM peptidoglycan-binding domain-containing protein [Chitinophaga japonensis]TWI82035.1 LysM domain-containing protein [Chitinophaga japonensis]
MVRSFLIIAGIMLGAAVAEAQEMLQVQGIAPDLYLVHTVQKGETFYSLSRTYSIPPKEIAAENQLTFEQGLQIGQQVKIPLTGSNFMQGSNAAGGAPVYHRVAEKETLYRISVNYNKVPLDNIRHWNNFSGDGVQKDSYLIVGWLKGGNGASAPAYAQTSVSPAPPATTPVSTAPASPAPAPPVTGAPTTPRQEQAPAAITPAPPVLTPAPPVQTGTSGATATQDTGAGSIAGTTPAAPAATPPPPATGSFEQIYMQQTAGRKATTEKGPGAWFKSNATAGKYYALHNSASRGTIVKVTNPLNGRSIYAKVLEAIPQMKQNEGLIIKLSDSAINALGTNEAKFYCELSYEN